MNNIPIRIQKNRILSISGLLASLAILISCGEIPHPLPSQCAYAQARSSHHLIVQSYDIPRSIFRGVFWPSEDEKWLTLWLFTGKKEHFVPLAVPPELITWKEDITSSWTIEPLDALNARRTYRAEHRDTNTNISIIIELPEKTRPFSFAVLRNVDNDEIILFMDLAEKIVDTGIVGYVIIQHSP